MWHRCQGRLLISAFRVKFRQLTSLSFNRNDLSELKSLPAKQLGKIALDVSRYSNSDIHLWRTFVECCSLKVDSFDGKDTLRVWKAICAFYRNYDHVVRAEDADFINQLIIRSHEVSSAYTCDELSQLAEFVCDFAATNNHLMEGATLLFSKISVMFNLRLAEALPYGVVRLLVSFSRLGIKDGHLLESLASFICKSDGFSEHDLRTILTSYALCSYRNDALLKHATDRFKALPGITLNELAILSFAYATLEYSTPDVQALFQRHLGNEAEDSGTGILNTEGPNVDLSLFCSNLDSLGVPMPRNVIEIINIETLSSESFFKVVHLLAPNAASQQKVSELYYEYEGLGTFWDHMRVLEYVTKGQFESQQFLRKVYSNLRDMILHADGVPGRAEFPHRFYESDAITSRKEQKCSSTNENVVHGNESENHVSREPEENTIDRKDQTGVPTENTEHSDKALSAFMILLLRIPPVITTGIFDTLAFADRCRLSPKSLCDLVLLASKALVDSASGIEQRLEDLASDNGTTLLEVIESHISTSDVSRAPWVLSADLESYLGEDVDVRCNIGILPVVAVLKKENVAVLPLYPSDFVSLGGESASAGEPWSPPGTGAHASVYATVYYLRKHGFRVCPLSYLRWCMRGEGVNGAFLTVATATAASDPGGIHLNIGILTFLTIGLDFSEYPKDEQNGKLDVATGDGAAPSDIRTPVVIIAPKPLVDYERLYKKMMHSAPSEKGHANIGGLLLCIHHKVSKRRIYCTTRKSRTPTRHHVASFCLRCVRLHAIASPCPAAEGSRGGFSILPRRLQRNGAGKQ
ncbi:Streptococcus pyogenes, putative [Babesia ovata]|uniref:Streptococcus pyogenes, putative n=1 Tax=Babesia ovata TaxID=189622 RepID=A0A2H6KEB5_9APIC|nr:Streptococcus pyogenes, putative [Babesia ovata]GBE61327.1 Streptococcus pyogenes, putative [Babesia ovata]